jgi:hypothetical protein
MNSIPRVDEGLHPHSFQPFFDQPEHQLLKSYTIELALNVAANIRSSTTAVPRIRPVYAQTKHNMNRFLSSLPTSNTK